MKVTCTGCGEDCSNAYATWHGGPYHVMCIPAPQRMKPSPAHQKPDLPPELVERVAKAAMDQIDCIDEAFLDRFQKISKAALAALRPGDVLPNGWVAPMEPTEQMLAAAERSEFPENFYHSMRDACIGDPIGIAVREIDTGLQRSVSDD